MLRQIFSAYISLKEAILERLKTSNKNKVEYGLFIPISLNLFANKAKNVWKCTQFNKYSNMLLYKNAIKKYQNKNYMLIFQIRNNLNPIAKIKSASFLFNL